jgi:hypothetical protein
VVTPDSGIVKVTLKAVKLEAATATPLTLNEQPIKLVPDSVTVPPGATEVGVNEVIVGAVRAASEPEVTQAD